MRLSAVGALASVVALAGPGPLPHYKLAVRIDPAAHALSVRGRLEGWPCAADTRLYLNLSFKIDSFRVGGRVVTPVFDTAAKPAPYAELTRPLVFQCHPGPVEFAYRGVIADTIERVNMVAPGLVELAQYSGWFPVDPSVAAFSYDVELDLPRGWTVAAAGPMRRAPAPAGRERVRFSAVSFPPDIPLIASPALTVRRAGAGAAGVEVYAIAGDSALAQTAVMDMGGALKLYQGWYGNPAGADSVPLRLVYSPRGGWGYHRLPLMLVPAEFSRVWAQKPMGRALTLQGASHELAHFWWRIADSNTTDDWINEGLAEYSAFTATSERFGPQLRDTLAATYRLHIGQLSSRMPIAATPSEARQARYVNRYEKPALLFASVQATVGAARFRDFLRAFHAAHASRRDATTASFMDAARAALGDAEGARIQRCITGEWTAECAPSGAPPQPAVVGSR